MRELRDSGRLLMVDEAELLLYRALEVLRRLHDKAGIGIVLAGMPRLLINLKGRRGEFAQLLPAVWRWRLTWAIRCRRKILTR